MVNEVRLLGYLRRKPLLAQTPNGTVYTVLVVETERSWQGSNGEKHTERQQHTVQVWRTLAEACVQYLRSNQLVYIAGRLHTREREDEDGTKIITTAVIAEQVRFLPCFHPPAQTPE